MGTYKFQSTPIAIIIKVLSFHSVAHVNHNLVHSSEPILRQWTFPVLKWNQGRNQTPTCFFEHQKRYRKYHQWHHFNIDSLIEMTSDTNAYKRLCLTWATLRNLNRYWKYQWPVTLECIRYSHITSENHWENFVCSWKTFYQLHAPVIQGIGKDGFSFHSNIDACKGSNPRMRVIQQWVQFHYVLNPSHFKVDDLTWVTRPHVVQEPGVI